jgi:hypothetical protein
MNSQPDYPGLRAPEPARGRARRHRVDTADQMNGCARMFGESQGRRGLESSSGLLAPISLSIPSAPPRTTSDSTDSIAVIAQAFTESQRQRRPVVVGSPFGLDEPSPEQIEELMGKGEPSKDPQQARAAMSIYRAVKSGELVVVED